MRILPCGLRPSFRTATGRQHHGDGFLFLLSLRTTGLEKEQVSQTGLAHWNFPDTGFILWTTFFCQRGPSTSCNHKSLTCAWLLFEHTLDTFLDLLFLPSLDHRRGFFPGLPWTFSHRTAIDTRTYLAQLRVEENKIDEKYCLLILFFCSLTRSLRQQQPRIFSGFLFAPVSLCFFFNLDSLCSS